MLVIGALGRMGSTWSVSDGSGLGWGTRGLLKPEALGGEDFRKGLRETGNPLSSVEKLVVMDRPDDGILSFQPYALLYPQARDAEMGSAGVSSPEG